jgi:DNA-binding NarL/FixJ family response regulator
MRHVNGAIIAKKWKQMNTNIISVGIVDDHTMFREGLVNLLKEYDHIRVLFEARNGLDMQKKLANSDIPDIIVMDISMPVMDGHGAIAWLKEQFPQVRVLALSMYEDDKSIIKMLRKGAAGYILKECHTAELVQAFACIMEKGYYINELVSGRLLRSVINTGESQDEFFTDRELEFMRLCCSELTYKEIADKMNVSPRTIDGYRDTLFEKLQIKSRTGLVLYAIKNSIVDIE